MKVVSIDVGISNLAVCLLSLDPVDDQEERPNAKVHYWKVLDLVEPEPEIKPLICSATVKRTKKSCEKKAQFKIGNDGFCKTHEPNKGQEMPGKVLVKKRKRRKVKTLTKQEICERMINAFDEIKENNELLNVDYILIELQPGKNQRMKALSEMIFTYFTLRRKDQTKTERKIKQVKFINAKNKLTIYTGPPIPCTLKDKYARRKYFGIKHCEFFIKRGDDNKDHVEMFTNSKKKDDLADCYLQGLYFLLK